jgi:hypothetical protein
MTEEEKAFREEFARFKLNSLSKESIAEYMRLTMLGRSKGWIDSPPPGPITRDPDGGAWDRTNPPKRGKKAKPSFYR